jgi:hypothetical protein
MAKSAWIPILLSFSIRKLMVLLVQVQIMTDQKKSKQIISCQKIIVVFCNFLKYQVQQQQHQ